MQRNISTNPLVPGFVHPKALVGMVDLKALKDCEIISLSIATFTGPHPTPITQDQATLDIYQLKPSAKKCSTDMTKADILKRNLGNDKLNPKGLSEITDTSDQTFSSLFRGSQNSMRKFRC